MRMVKLIIAIGIFALFSGCLFDTDNTDDDDSSDNSGSTSKWKSYVYEEDVKVYVRRSTDSASISDAVVTAYVMDEYKKSSHTSSSGTASIRNVLYKKYTTTPPSVVKSLHVEAKASNFKTGKVSKTIEMGGETSIFTVYLSPL